MSDREVTVASQTAPGNTPGGQDLGARSAYDAPAAPQHRARARKAQFDAAVIATMAEAEAVQPLRGVR